MCSTSSLPPVPPAEVRAVADRLLERATSVLKVPALGPAVDRARQAMATTTIGDAIFDDERTLRDALEDVGTAVLHTLARLETL